MIFTLGGHLSPNQTSKLSASSCNIDCRAQTQLRNIFWLSYTLEQDLCLRTGRASIFSEENCDLTLPTGYIEQLYSCPRFVHHSEHLPETPIFPVDLRLSIIKARIYHTLYSLRALRKSDTEILKDIRELDDELERWRLIVPLESRPSLYFSHETSGPEVHMHSLFLMFNYHLCIDLIHRASSRCKPIVQGRMIDGVSSSLALSVEASRSMLTYLEAAEHVVIEGMFR